jgi:signal transduction histidine kinase
MGILAVIIGVLLFHTPILAKLPNKIVERCFQLGVLSVSLGWASILATFFCLFGMMNTNTLLTSIVVCGVNAGAFVLLTPHRTLFLSYFIPMALIPPVAAITVAHNVQDLTLLILMVLYNLFLLLSAPPIRRRFETAITNKLHLAHERDKMKALLNSFPGFVSILDQDLRYQMVNTHGKDVSGIEQFEGQKLGFTYPDSQFVSSVHEFVKGTQATHSKEIKMDFGNGHQWGLLTMSRLEQPQGWIVAACVFIDELVMARQTADYTARLASLGEMAQGLAHEINNPLAVVMFSADELANRARKQDLEPEQIENFAGKILTMGQRINKIVKGLRYFSRDAEADPVRAVPVSLILDQVVDFCQEKYRHEGIRLEIAPYDEALMIKCREVQIMQALLNLLNNARDAASNSEDPWIKIEVKARQGKAVMIISDSGTGIPADKAMRVFEPFFTTKDVGQGTGLGLSIALGLVQYNKGELHYLGPDPTRFELSLDLAE